MKMLAPLSVILELSRFFLWLFINIQPETVLLYLPRKNPHTVLAIQRINASNKKARRTATPLPRSASLLVRTLRTLKYLNLLTCRAKTRCLRSNSLLSSSGHALSQALKILGLEWRNRPWVVTICRSRRSCRPSRPCSLKIPLRTCEICTSRKASSSTCLWINCSYQPMHISDKHKTEKHRVHYRQAAAWDFFHSTLRADTVNKQSSCLSNVVLFVQLPLSSVGTIASCTYLYFLSQSSLFETTQVLEQLGRPQNVRQIVRLWRGEIAFRWFKE